jgi:hypothetical protein
MVLKALLVLSSITRRFYYLTFSLTKDAKQKKWE